MKTVMPFTAGPWQARQNDLGQWCVFSSGGDIAKTGSTHRQPRTKKTERKANAMLMAAAPDMIEALQMIANLRPSATDDAWDRVEQAIAKAFDGL